MPPRSAEMDKDETLAWLRRKSASMFPIPGASRAESAESSARAATLELAAEDVARIDAHVGFPA